MQDKSTAKYLEKSLVTMKKALKPKVWKRVWWFLCMETHIIPKVSEVLGNSDNFGLWQHENFLQWFSNTAQVLLEHCLPPHNSSPLSIVAAPRVSKTLSLVRHSTIILPLSAICCSRLLSVATFELLFSGCWSRHCPQGLLHLFNFSKLVSLKWSKKQAQL